MGTSVSNLKLLKRSRFLQDPQPKYKPAGKQSLCQKNHASLQRKVSCSARFKSAASDLTSKNLRYLSTSNLQRDRLEERNSAEILDFRSSPKPAKYCATLICLTRPPSHPREAVYTSTPRGLEEQKHCCLPGAAQAGMGHTATCEQDNSRVIIWVPDVFRA